MKTLTIIFGFMLLIAMTACAPPATPTPVPTPIPTATVAPFPTRFPTPTIYDARHMPGCDGFEPLADRFRFEWPGIEEIKDVTDWAYFRCTQSPTQVAAFYREKMVNPPYNWQEIAWVERPEGTLGVYFHTVFQRWLYVWMLPRPNDPKAHLVVAEREGDVPLDLPCH
jgi:hypothetical protein